MGVVMRRGERTEAIRRSLLDAARRVFLTDGYHGATLDRIAAEAGYTKGVVYSRFASKADLLLALLEDRIEARIEQNEQLLATLDGGGLPALASRWAAIQRDDMAWTLLVVEFRVHAARDPELNERYAALHQRTVAGVEAIIERALGPAAIGKAHDIAQFLLAAGLGITIEQAVDPGALAPETAAELIRHLVGGAP